MIRTIVSRHFACAVTRRSASRQRVAITLLEVLLSIGVMSVGLLSVIVLIPVAQHKAEEGTLADRQASAGRVAFRDFQIRDMGNPARWYSFDPSSVNITVPLDRRLSFCIDPLFLSDPVVVGSTPVLARSFFPYGVYAPATGFMHRVTLRSRLGLDIPMPQGQADQIFRMLDDLTFEAPASDESLGAEQTVLGIDTSGDGAINAENDIVWKRYAEGKVSWMATLVPEPVASGNEYRLSVIVFSQRSLTPDTSGNLGDEGVVSVTNFYSAGLSGGDVRVDSSANPTAVAQLAELRPGDWVMLHAQQAMLMPNGVPTPASYFRWYRVVAADESDTTQPSSWRELTLQGPDWRDSNNNTSMTMVRGVVAVFEKTVTLPL